MSRWTKPMQESTVVGGAPSIENMELRGRGLHVPRPGTLAYRVLQCLSWEKPVTAVEVRAMLNHPQSLQSTLSQLARSGLVQQVRLNRQIVTSATRPSFRLRPVAYLRQKNLIVNTTVCAKRWLDLVVIVHRHTGTTVPLSDDEVAEILVAALRAKGPGF